MRRKVVFPYGYLDSFENFNATQLPSSIDSFYNFLVKKIVVYMTFAQKVWQTFNSRTNKDYFF